ncbi:unnamed protein product [Paramecium primaurelia]|uniref:RING-type domain-containing protein n=1 Tax=Paramecium primaurelia TaxID=5886 RepID=A0A8S1MPK0_PARPR|nr:unnamed protein product [Paramecium primaurelia]
MNKIIDIGKDYKQRKFLEKPTRQEDKHDSFQQNQQTFEIPECAICCEQMIQDLSTLVPCGHIFHQRCIKHYSKLECPICRKQNKQSIPIHFSIELNQNKSLEIKQNKLIKNQQFANQKTQNQDSINNQVWELICQGKHHFDYLYSQNLFFKQNNRNEIQLLKSFENVLKELYNNHRDINNQIESQAYLSNQISKSSTPIQKQKHQTPTKIAEKAFQPSASGVQFPDWKKVIDIGDKKNFNIRYCNKPTSNLNRNSYRSNSYNKQQQ